jgi:enoyl-CoA hydratase/carnithine racemase
MARTYAALDRLNRMDKVVVTAINGLDLAMGCVFALACNIRLIAEDAEIGLTEAALNVLAGAGGSQRLVRMIGTARALDLLLDGRWLSAREARQTGGLPGIIPFELAGNASRTEHIMAVWGCDGRRAARWSLWLDFGYMLSYGVLTAILVDQARRQWRHPRALPALVAPAVVADAIEEVALLRVLAGHDIAMNARRAQVAAITKFAILVVSLSYVVAARVYGRRRRC